MRQIMKVTGLLLPVAMLALACGTHSNPPKNSAVTPQSTTETPSSASPDNANQAATVNIPSAVIARVPKSELGNSSSDAAEYVTVNQLASSTDGQNLAELFAQGQPLAQNSATDASQSGLMLNGGYAGYGGCGSCYWNFPVLRTVGAVLSVGGRILLGVGRAIRNVVWGVDQVLTQQTPVFYNGGYGYTYGYNQNADYTDYRYYYYPGSGCFQGNLPGQWQPNTTGPNPNSTCTVPNGTSPYTPIDNTGAMTCPTGTQIQNTSGYPGCFPTSSTNCPAGTTIQVNGSCVPVSDQQCPNGTLRLPSGNCVVPPSQQAGCQFGYYKQADGSCSAYPW